MNFVTEPPSGEIILSRSAQEVRKENQAELQMGHKRGKESVAGATKGNRSREEWNTQDKKNLKTMFCQKMSQWYLAHSILEFKNLKVDYLNAI